jgi:hypothetical protein
LLLRSELATPCDPFILPDVTSKEPLGPVLREDDFQWLKIVKLMQFAMLDVDEFGVDQANIDIATTSQKPCVRQGLGGARHTACRQLRRRLRPRPGHSLEVGHRPRPQQFAGSGRQICTVRSGNSACRVVLRGYACPMIHGVGEPVVAGLPPDDNAALARTLGDRRDSCQTVKLRRAA